MKNIHKHVHMPHMYLAAFFGTLFGLLTGLSGIWYTSAASFAASLINISGIYGTPHVLGTFQVNGSGGNAGQITFLSGGQEAAAGGSGVYLDTAAQTISGNFFLETAGWVTMTGVGIIPPADMNVMTPWALNGYAWSENAGWIDFTAQNTTYSGAGYIPGSQTFSGYAWSDNLGYIGFSGSGGQQFKNRIKILGNIGGSKSFDTEYALGTKFDAVNTTSIVNTVRKNTSLTTRSLRADQINIASTENKTVNGIAYYKGNYAISSSKLVSTVRTLIIEGGDVIIDGNVAKDAQKTRAIIAIKDATGKGGNIYVKGDVKNIYASLIAEGTVYSGDASTNIYNDTTVELTQLPKSQLYILGSVISRNTIGGSARIPAICPFTETTCGNEKSFRYDWNYFRTFDGLSTSRSDKLGYDAYSVIIESDPRLTSNPPPGLTP